MEQKVWLPGMDSNHELDIFLKAHNLLILQSRAKSSKAPKADIWYKNGTKTFDYALTSTVADVSR
jgi:hypothetical protein